MRGKLAIFTMLESSGKRTFCVYCIKPGFINDLRTPHLRYQIVATSNLERAIHESVEFCEFFDIGRDQVVREFLLLVGFQYITTEELASAAESWFNCFGYQYGEEYLQWREENYSFSKPTFEE